MVSTGPRWCVKGQHDGVPPVPPHTVTRGGRCLSVGAAAVERTCLPARQETRARLTEPAGPSPHLCAA